MRNKEVLAVVALLFLGAFLLFVFSANLTGKAIADISDSFNINDSFSGKINLVFEEGDFVQKDSRIEMGLKREGANIMEKSISFEEYMNGLSEYNEVSETRENCVDSVSQENQEVCSDEIDDETNETVQICQNETVENNEPVCSTETLTDYYYNEAGEYSRDTENFLEHVFNQEGNYAFYISIPSLGINYEKNFVVSSGLDGEEGSSRFGASNYQANFVYSDCPGIIDEPGYYELGQNLETTGSCFIIDADNVILDGKGYTITGDGDGDDYGIYVLSRSNITIIDFGAIQSFSSGGIWLEGVTNVSVRNVVVTGSSSDNIHLDSVSSSELYNIASSGSGSCGLFVTSSESNTLEIIDSSDNGADGICLGSSSNNNFTTITTNGHLGGEGISIGNSNSNIFNGIVSSGNQYGVYMYSSHYNSFTDVLAENDVLADGIKLAYSEFNNFTDVVVNYYYNGIWLDYSDSNTFRNVHTEGNNYAGVSLVGSDLNLFQNLTSIANNYAGVSLVGSDLNLFQNLTSIANSNVGVYLDGTSEGFSNNFNELYVASNPDTGFFSYYGTGTVLNNSLFENNGDGIYFEGTTGAILSNITSRLNNYDGLDMRDMSYGSFSNITLFQNDYGGLFIQGGGNNNFSSILADGSSSENVYLTSSSSNIFRDLTAISGGSYGLYIDGSSNQFANLNISYNNDIGIYVNVDLNSFTNIIANYNSGGMYIYSNSNTVNNLTASYSTGNSGLSIGGSYNVVNNAVVAGNNPGSDTVSGVIIDGPSMGAGNNNLTNIVSNDNIGLSGYGIYLSNTAGNRLTNITANNNILRAIYLGSSGGNILINVTVNGTSDDGIYIYFSSSGNIFSNVQTTNNQGSGIFSDSSESNVFSNVQSSGNSNSGLDIEWSNYNNFTNITANSNSGTDFLAINSESIYLYEYSGSIGSYSITIGNISNPVFGNAYGLITYKESIAGEGSNLFGDSESDIKISSNLVYVNSSQTDLNKSAEIKVYNSVGENWSDSYILRDGQFRCDSTTVPKCINLSSLYASTFIFNVTSWSNYSIVANDSTPPLIYDLSPADEETRAVVPVSFRFNITDTGNRIANCSLLISGVVKTSKSSGLSTLSRNNISYNPGDNGLYNYSISCTDTSGNIGASDYLLFALNVPSSSQPASSGSSGGGGGGGGGIISGATYSLEDGQFEVGYMKALEVNDRIKVVLDSEIHYVQLISFNALTNVATLEVRSSPIKVVLNLGDTKKIDVDGNGFYDLLLRFDSVTDGKPSIFVKKTYEAVPVYEDRGSDGSAGEKIVETLKETARRQGALIYLILLVLVVGIGAVVTIIYVLPKMHLFKVFRGIKEKPEKVFDLIIREAERASKEGNKEKAKSLYSRANHMYRYLNDDEKRRAKKQLESLSKAVKK